MSGWPTSDIDLADLDLNLIFVRSPGGYLYELNPGDVNSPSKVLPKFLPWFRLFKGEDFTLMAEMLNSLTIRAALQARQVPVTGAAYEVQLGDYNVMVSRNGAVDISLPPIEDWVTGGYVGAPIWIKDAGRFASVANRIRALPNGVETIEGFANWDIAQAGQSVRLTPDLSTLTRWLVQ